MGCCCVLLDVGGNNTRVENEVGMMPEMPVVVRGECLRCCRKRKVSTFAGRESIRSATAICNGVMSRSRSALACSWIRLATWCGG